MSEQEWPKKSRTYDRETHLGKMYVVVAYDNDANTPDNLFAYAQGGPCFISEAEALGRALNLMHKHGVPISEIIEQWSEIQCEPHWEDGKQVKSIADGIAQCLREALNEGIPI